MSTKAPIIPEGQPTATPPGTGWRQLSRRTIGLAVALILVMATVALVIRWGLTRDRSTRPTAARPLAFSGGAASALRQTFARMLANEAAKQGLVLRVVPTDGSQDAAERIERGQLDLALLQGGLDYSGSPRLRQIATLHVEPVHLLVKADLANGREGQPFALTDLRGMRIAIGGEGSGTHALAPRLLAFAGLLPGRDYRPVETPIDELERVGRDFAPDAVFLVSSLPSGVVRHLLRDRGYRLVPLRFADAFGLAAVDEETDLSLLAAPGDLKVEEHRVVATVIPPFTYGIDRGGPEDGLPTLGMRLILAGRADLPAGTVEKLLPLVYDGRFTLVGRPPLTDELLNLPPEIPWHDGTVLYKDRNKPLIAADAIDMTEKGFSIFGAVLSITGTLGLAYLSSWQWFRRRARRLRDLRFEAYIGRVAAIERKALKSETAAVLDLDRLMELQKELSRVKTDALDQFAQGRIESGELMSGFLAQINDARDYLTRLILHQRENQEEINRDRTRTVGLIRYHPRLLAIEHEALTETSGGLVEPGRIVAWELALIRLLQEVHEAYRRKEFDDPIILLEFVRDADRVRRRWELPPIPASPAEGA